MNISVYICNICNKEYKLKHHYTSHLNKNSCKNPSIQTKGLKRNSIDKFYTKDECVQSCINIFKKYIQLSNDDLLIEPSAGNGAFIPYIKNISNNYIFYDLNPEHKEIIEQDFLLLDTTHIKNIYKKSIHIIGNPPFGRQSSLAKKFIKTSCSFCDSLSFILPKSFKKESLKKSIPLDFHLIEEIDLPKNSFLLNNIEHDVPCIFQIWIKKSINRDIKEKLNPLSFIFVKKNQNPDISVRRVGINAGTIDTKIGNKSIQSHYFIKFTNNIDTDINIKKLSKINYIFDNTVGPKSISKQELITYFNPLL